MLWLPDRQPGRGSINAADNAWIPCPLVTSPGLPQDRLQAFRRAPALNDHVGFEQPSQNRFPLLVGAVAEVKRDPGCQCRRL